MHGKSLKEQAPLAGRPGLEDTGWLTLYSVVTEPLFVPGTPGAGLKGKPMKKEDLPARRGSGHGRRRTAPSRCQGGQPRAWPV